MPARRSLHPVLRVAALAALLPAAALAQDRGFDRDPTFAPDEVDPPRTFDRGVAPRPGLADGEAFSTPTPLPAEKGDATAPGFEESPEFGVAKVPGPPRPAVDVLPGTPFFADSQYGARPDPGPPGAPGFGLPHRPEQTNRYGIWYRPKSFHAPNRAVYRPSPFRPRGFGNLFDRPCVPDRLDYARYTVRDLPSRYGPTYYPHYRENTECLIRPTRSYDRGPHAEDATGGCRLGGECYEKSGGECGCPTCRPASHAAAHAAPAACGCPKCRAGR